MSRLFVPPAVARELLDERQQFTAAVIKACQKNHVCRRWDRELKKLDPHLEMILADVSVVGTPLLAGYYHLVRHNPTTMPSVTPVTGPNGERIEPPGDILERLKSLDLQNPNVVRLHQMAQEAEQRRAERIKEQETEERRAEILDRWRAVSETSVSLNRDTPWAQNAAGLRKRGPR